MEGLSRRKGGGLFPTEARVSVVETATGRLLLALVRDISERKQAEKLLQRRAGQQQAIAKLGAGALSGVSMERLLNETAKTIASTLGVEICGYLNICGNGANSSPAPSELPRGGARPPRALRQPEFRRGLRSW